MGWYLQATDRDCFAGPELRVPGVFLGKFCWKSVDYMGSLIAMEVIGDVSLVGIEDVK
jgi:hypothetical protein